jgi:hypothetical protein
MLFEYSRLLTVIKALHSVQGSADIWTGCTDGVHCQCLRIRRLFCYVLCSQPGAFVCVVRTANSTLASSMLLRHAGAKEVL